jgi:hypothetical protein
MLERCKISLTCVDKSSPHVVPAASLVPTGSSAVAGDNSACGVAIRNGGVNTSSSGMLAQDRPDANSQSALAPEMAADSATGLQLSDPAAPVAGSFDDGIPDFLRRVG